MALSAQKKIPHPEFAQRMQLACDGNPDVPPPNYGRLGWFASQFEIKFHVTVTVETIRKWFAGETIPRNDKMVYLAQILGVDVAWLSLGKSPEFSEKQQRMRNATADGAVNVIAGLIQMNGANPAFPLPDDARAKAHKIDLTAVIKGANYAFHVARGDQKPDGWHFVVPIEAIGETIVIGVMPIAPTVCEFVELDQEGIEVEGKRKGGFYEVLVPTDGSGRPWRRITTFAERL